MKHSCQKTLENTVKKCQQAKLSQKIKLLIQENSRQSPRPVRMGLHCQARCDHHPWRQYSLCCLNLQLNNGGGSSHPSPLLVRLKRWQSDHTCHPPHRFNELGTKNEKWNGKPRSETASKSPVGVLPWTWQSEGKWPSRQTGGQSNHHKWHVSWKILSAEELETLPGGLKPRTSHHWSPGGKITWLW